MMKLFYFVPFILLFNSHLIFGQACEIYEWPAQVRDIKKLGMDLRLKLLSQEMEEFSKKVGHCYNREPVGLSEKVWLSSKRDENIEKIFKANSLKKLCENVKKYLVQETLPFSKKDPSAFIQYANCAEAQFVGACLAYHFGFPAEEIKLCDAESDHAWSLVPEPGKENSYCLLDRWNSFRCGVKLVGKQNPYSWDGDVKVPGKFIFNFSNASCRRLIDSGVF